MDEFRLVRTDGVAVSIYPHEESDKELRKLLNAAWDEGRWRGRNQPRLNTIKKGRSARYRDVSRILKEAKSKPKAYDNPVEEEK